MARAGTGGPDGFGYTWTDNVAPLTPGAPTFDWHDVAGGTLEPVSGDDATERIALPFPFPFYGTIYDSISICSNGWVSFVADTTVRTYSNVPIPDAAPGAFGTPLAAIYVFWDDMRVNMPPGGPVFTLLPSPGDPRFFIIYDGAELPYTGTGNLFAEVALSPDGTIDLYYGANTATPPNAQGGSATVGIQDENGVVGLQYSFDTPTIDSGLAIRFSSNVHTAIDLTARRIDGFGGTITPDSTRVPMLLVLNRGDSAITTGSARMVITPNGGLTEYDHLVTLPTLAAGESLSVPFPAWTPAHAGPYHIVANVATPGDGSAHNDTARVDIFVAARHDYALTRLDGFGGLFTVESTSVPVAHLQNLSPRLEAGASVHLVVTRTGGIVEYDHVATFTDVAGHDSATVPFPPYTPGAAGDHQAVANVMFASDENPSNDTARVNFIVNGTTTRGGPDGGGYTWVDSRDPGADAPSFEWVDLATPETLIYSNPDDASNKVALPFPFPYYGNTYDSIDVCTNAHLGFGPGVSTSLGNGPIPNAILPNNRVYLFWDDLEVPPATASVTVGMGTYHGGSVWVATFMGVSRLGAPTGGVLNAQAILTPTGSIILQYRSTPGTTVSDATIGTEDSTGTIGLQYLYNHLPPDHLPDSARAIRFAPTPVGPDTVGPVIAHVPPMYTATTAFPFALTASISDRSGVASATLHYARNGGAESALDMTLVGGQYSASISGLVPGDSITYYFTATDAASSPNGSRAPVTGMYLLQVTRDSIGPGATFSVGPPITVPTTHHILSIDWSDDNGVRGDTLVVRRGTSVLAVMRADSTTVLSPTRLRCWYTVDCSVAPETLRLQFNALDGATPANRTLTPFYDLPIYDAHRPVGAGYRGFDNLAVDTAAPATFFWVELAPSLGGTGDVLALGNDEVSGPQILSRRFRFAGSNYSAVRVSSNGWMTFDVAVTVPVPTPPVEPSTDAPNAVLAPWWSDLDPTVIVDPNTGIYFFDDTEAGRFVVEWRSLQHVGDVADAWSVEVVGEYATGVIWFNYLACPRAFDTQSFAGLESPDGGQMLAYNDHGQMSIAGVPADSTSLRMRSTETGVALTAILRPTASALEPAYPNPFNPQTTLAVDLAMAGRVRVDALDVLGRTVATLADGLLPAGRTRLTWRPEGLASGVYTLRLTAGTRVSTQPVTYVR